MQVARAAVDSLHEIGLDLVCVLDSLSRKDIEKIIYIKRDHLLDAAQQRAREDLWRPMNHFNESMVMKFVGEMEALGLGAAVRPLVYDECWVSKMNLRLLLTSLRGPPVATIAHVVSDFCSEATW